MIRVNLCAMVRIVHKIGYQAFFSAPSLFSIIVVLLFESFPVLKGMLHMIAS